MSPLSVPTSPFGWLQKHVLVLGMVLTACLMTACTESDDYTKYTPVVHHIDNHPLPVGRDTLRVLAIGNSFTIDGVSCIGHILDDLQVPRTNYCVYALYKGGASLEYWDTQALVDATDSLSLMAGRLIMPTKHGTISQLVAQDWDVIVFQQYSKLTINFSTYHPYLNHLISFCTTHCTNPQVAFAWQLITAYAFQSQHNVEQLTSAQRWRSIAGNSQEVADKVGIDIVIPAGTAIQNARATALQTPTELTRDYYHLCYGVARHTAALTWVQTLFAPVFGISILNSTANHPLSLFEQTASGIIGGSSVPVTDENRQLCIDCAYMACQSPYMLSYF